MQRPFYLTLSCFIFVVNNVHYIQEKVQKKIHENNKQADI